MGDEFGVVGDADVAIAESLLESFEHLGSEIEVPVGVVGFGAAVDAVSFDGVEFICAVDDGAADPDFVDDHGFDVVAARDVEDSTGGLHEVGSSECGHFENFGPAANDGDGLVVSEACDVDAHDGFLFVGNSDVPIDGGFDESESDEGVVGFVGELAEDSDLVCGGFGSSLVGEVLCPFGCSDSAEVVVGSLYQVVGAVGEEGVFVGTACFVLAGFPRPRE